MTIDISKLNHPIALFGNGEKPFHPKPIEILKNAGSILCADGGANKLKQIGFAKIKDNDLYIRILSKDDQSKNVQK